MTSGSAGVAPGDSPRSQLEEDAPRDPRIETGHTVHCSLSHSVQNCSAPLLPPLPLKIFWFPVALWVVPGLFPPVLGEGRSVCLLCLCLFHVIGDNKQLDNPAGVAPERSIRVATSWELGSEERSRVCVLVVGAESLGKGLCTLQVCALTTLRTMFCDDFFFLL